MKHLLSLVLLLAAGLGATSARAQAYQPFRFGLSYQLSANCHARRYYAPAAAGEPAGAGCRFAVPVR